MLFNTDLALWENAHKSYAAMPNGGAILRVHDGMIHDGLQVLARFKTSADAASVLSNAGFRSIDPTGYKAQ